MGEIPRVERWALLNLRFFKGGWWHVNLCGRWLTTRERVVKFRRRGYENPDVKTTPTGVRHVSTEDVLNSESGQAIVERTADARRRHG